MDSGMIESIQTGNIKALYESIKRDPYVLERIDQVPFLDTPLHLAACTDHVAFVLEMLNLKPSFAKKLNQDGFSPLHLALQNDKIPIVLRLLKFDKDLVRVKGKEGMTPLHLAVQIGNLGILIKFLELCPEAIEDVTVHEETAFHIALKYNKFEAFEVLVGWLRRSCHKAAQSWENELLISGDFEGNTVMHIAVIQNRPSVVKLLLENFSHDQINVKNLEGLTALDIARSDYPKIYDMLSSATLIQSLVRKMSDSSVRRLVGSSFLKKPNSCAKIDSLRSKMSCYKKFKTSIARGRTGMSEGRRNTFLIVTVLIITATYTAFLNPPYYRKDGNGGNDFAPAPSSGPSVFGIDPVDIYSLFWLYNTLTFWASVWLTAFLLPSSSLICLFLLITLSLFGSCYMLLMVAFSSNLGSVYGFFATSLPWCYSICNVNLICSSFLALLVAYRIARYACLNSAKTRRGLLFLILLVSFVFVVTSMIFPAVMLSEMVLLFFRPFKCLIYVMYQKSV